jgi:hypothetical protein
MSPNCIGVERIADVENAPELQRHVAECPRCQTLWLSYQSFMKADVSGAPRADEARRALEATIRRSAASATAAANAAPRVSRLSTHRRAQLSWLRPGLIAAVAAIVAMVAISVWRGSSDEPLLRGESETTWTLETPHVSAIAIVFKWSPVPDADAYEVEIYDDALNLVLHSTAVTTPDITVDRAALANVPTGTKLTWRVRAFRGGDVIATSPPASLILQ